MNLIKLKPLHYFGFLYVAFAHLTDKKYKRAEQLTIWQSVSKWSNSKMEHNEYSSVMDEVMEWYKNTLHHDHFEIEIFEIAESINNFSWFSKNNKIDSLIDLKEIAVSDKLFLKKEKLWIQKIGKIWGLSTQEIQNIINS